MSTLATDELLTLTRRLLDAIVHGDWATYSQLCAPSLTAFEPEACGHLVEGLDFHRYYFDLKRPQRPINTTIVAPHVRMLGPDAAIVSYVRLVQSMDSGGTTHTRRHDETRIWQRLDGAWRHVHFHRS